MEQNKHDVCAMLGHTQQQISWRLANLKNVFFSCFWMFFFWVYNLYNIMELTKKLLLYYIYRILQITVSWNSFSNGVKFFFFNVDIKYFTDFSMHSFLIQTNTGWSIQNKIARKSSSLIWWIFLRILLMVACS